MRIIFYIILGLCAAQPCRAAEELVAHPAPMQCQPKSLLAKDIILYEKYQSVLKVLAGIAESVELTECIEEFQDLSAWAGKNNGRRPKDFLSRVKLLRNVIIESTEIPDTVKDDALTVLNGIAKKRVRLSRGAKWGIGSAVVAAALLGLLATACLKGKKKSLVRAQGMGLIEAINTNNVDRVRQLIQQGADVNQVVEGYGWTFLYSAVIHRNLDIARLLIESGASVHGRNDDEGGESWPHVPLRACDRYTLDMAQLLIERGADINEIYPDGYNILGIHIGSSDLGIARLLIENGANVNARDGFGKTHLFLAALFGRRNAVKLLLGHGATVSFSPAEWDDLRGNQEMYHFLRAKEAQDVRWNRPVKTAWIGAVARTMNAVASGRLPARRSGGAV